ncbi:hypothetical protein CC2G_009237 [Coprinopsis cinerea AmutBmut pab1-1]|nr:hypothetical protein CC2G_009237 [Coprinopsis cinerea AmutBmut pab1-1]
MCTYQMELQPSKSTGAHLSTVQDSLWLLLIVTTVATLYQRSALGSEVLLISLFALRRLPPKVASCDHAGSAKALAWTLTSSYVHASFSVCQILQDVPPPESNGSEFVSIPARQVRGSLSDTAMDSGNVVECPSF